MAKNNKIQNSNNNNNNNNNNKITTTTTITTPTTATKTTITTITTSTITTTAFKDGGVILAIFGHLSESFGGLGAVMGAFGGPLR